MSLVKANRQLTALRCVLHYEVLHTTHHSASVITLRVMAGSCCPRPRVVPLRLRLYPVTDDGEIRCASWTMWLSSFLLAGEPPLPTTIDQPSCQVCHSTTPAGAAQRSWQPSQNLHAIVDLYDSPSARLRSAPPPGTHSPQCCTARFFPPPIVVAMLTCCFASNSSDEKSRTGSGCICPENMFEISKCRCLFV